MVASLPQERTFKQEFDRTRLAAIRGDSFSVPLGANNSNFFEGDEGDTSEAANNDRFFSQGSEDGILAQYPLTPSLSGGMDTAAIDPNNFSYLQQQARMKEGIGAPSLLPDDVASLPDPEFSTEEDPVTFGESLGYLEQRARGAEDIEEVQAASGAVQRKIEEASNQFEEEIKRMAKEKMSRWTAKGVGNGGNALDTAPALAWIVFAITYCYLMARGVVSLFVPESSVVGQGKPLINAGKKALHAFFPPYRPLREPGDFAYFLWLFFLTCIIVCQEIAIYVVIAHVFLIPLIPFFTP